jgi:tape measure domain-containing protein
MADIDVGSAYVGIKSDDSQARAVFKSFMEYAEKISNGFEKAGDVISNGMEKGEKAVKKTKKVVEQMAETTEQVADAQKKVVEQTQKAQTEVQKATQNMKKSFSDLKGTMKSIGTDMVDAFKKPITYLKNMPKQISTSIKQIPSAVSSGFTIAKQKAIDQINGMRVGVLNGISKIVQGTTNTVGKIANAFKNAGTNAKDGFVNAIKGIGNFAKNIILSPITAVKQLGNSFKSIKEGASNAVKSAKQSLSSLRGESNDTRISIAKIATAFGLLKAASAIIGTIKNQLSALGSETVTASDSIDKFNSTMQFAGFDAKEIKKTQKAVKDYADQTVYELGDVLNTTAQLGANGVDNYEKLTEAAGNLNAVAGGNADTFKSVAMVLTQTAGAGKLTTENWNQLTDAIPGASGRLQEAMLKNGAYTGNFRDAMEAGEITAEEFNQAIMQLGMEDAAQKAARSTSTFEGAIGNLKAQVVSSMLDILDAIGKENITDFINRITDKIGELTTEFINNIPKIKQTIADLFDKFQEMKPTIEAVGLSLVAFFGVLKTISTISNVVDIIKGVSSAFRGLAIAEDAATLSKKAFDIVMLATNPFVLIVAGIAALVAAFVFAYLKIKPFRDFINGLFEDIKTFALQVYDTYIKPAIDEVVRSFNELATAIKAWWDENGAQFIQALQNFLSMIWAFLQPALGLWSGIFGATFRTIVDLVKIGWDTVKGLFTGAFTILKGILDVFIGVFTGDWSKAWDGVKNIFSGAWKIITSGFQGFVNGISRIASGIGDAIGSGIGGAVNGVIDAINWVLDKLGAAKIGHVSWGSSKGGSSYSGGSSKQAAYYANGTDGHPGGHAIVNDGNGAELVLNPDGSGVIPEGKNVFIPNMRRGTRVFTAEQTASLFGRVKPTFRYAKGIGNSILDFTGDILDFIKDPVGLLKDVAGKFLNFGNLWQPWLGMAKGGANYIMDSAKDYLTKLFKKKEESEKVSYNASAGVKQWESIAKKALQMTGQYSAANLSALLYQMQTESGGNPNAVNNWDINAINGVPSKGLMQVIQPTFAAYAMPGHSSNILDPLSNILASIRYTLSRYGSLTAGWRGVGYANGGLITQQHLAMVGEGNNAEMIIPLTNPKRAWELILQAIEYMTGGGLGNSVSSVVSYANNVQQSALSGLQSAITSGSFGTSGSYSYSDNTYMLEAILSAIYKLNSALNGASFNIDGVKAGELVAPGVNKSNQYRNQMINKLKG